MIAWGCCGACSCGCCCGRYDFESAAATSAVFALDSLGFVVTLDELEDEGEEVEDEVLDLIREAIPNLWFNEEYHSCKNEITKSTFTFSPFSSAY